MSYDFVIGRSDFFISRFLQSLWNELTGPRVMKHVTQCLAFGKCTVLTPSTKDNEDRIRQELHDDRKVSTTGRMREQRDGG